MRIFTRNTLFNHDNRKRVEWIRWAMRASGYPEPKGDFAIEAHVIDALRRASSDPLPDLPLTTQLLTGVGKGKE